MRADTESSTKSLESNTRPTRAARADTESNTKSLESNTYQRGMGEVEREEERESRKRELSADTDTDVSFTSPVVEHRDKKVKPKEAKKTKMANEQDDKMDTILKSLNDLNRKHDETSKIIGDIQSHFATKDDIKAIRGDMDRIVKSLTKRIDVLENRVYDLEKEKDGLTNSISSLTNEKEELKGKLQSQRQKLSNCERDLNDLEQYGRGWNLRFFGIPEAEMGNKETTSDCIDKIVNLAKDKLKITLDSDCFEIAHRTGMRQSDGRDGDGVGARAGSANFDAVGGRRPPRARPVIARFHSRSVRDRILANRKKLKGSGLAIGEDLTAKNFRCLKQVQEHSATLSSWSHRGKILTKLKNGVVIQIHPSTDIEELISKGKRGITN